MTNSANPSSDNINERKDSPKLPEEAHDKIE
jgi:hypothetical protein